MSPLGIFRGSADKYAAAGQPLGLAPASVSTLFGRETFDLRSRSEGMDTRRDIPYVLAGTVDGLPTEVVELKVRTQHRGSDDTPEWREERWLVAMADLAERFPAVTIEPRGALGRLFKSVGYKGVETGDAAFDRAYHVSGEHDAALSILRPDVTAWLTAQRPADARFELAGSCILVARRDWGPDEIPTLLQLMRAFRAQIFAATPAAPVARPAPQSTPLVTQGGSAAARFCGSCGSALVPGSRFCGSCGATTAPPS
ncbi:MAG: hypothetical protein KGQ88_00025 [Chloroflexi bacterium]|nr:hypothetical protein [Chloroflexota bacterium]MDE3113861.1 zinc ribbon domain-containing protein [Chloroflexota bacterium]